MIDKEMILGFSLLPNGRLPIEYSENQSTYVKDLVIKNQIVEKILQVISNPKNILNLTSIVTMDDFKNISDGDKAIVDTANPGSIYKTIEENAVGKDTIGVVAVAGKGFSTATNYLNNKISIAKKALMAGDFNLAKENLDLVFKISEGSDFILLSNLNLYWIEDYLKSNQIPEEFSALRDNLLRAYSKFIMQHDSYIYNGELLNCAADNAKELILRKINAHSEWADMYIAGIMIGYSLNEIKEIMKDPEVEKFILTKKKSPASNWKPKFKISDEGLKAKFDRIYSASKELQLLGALAGINQGFPTKIYDIIKKINSISISVDGFYELEFGDSMNFDILRFFDDEDYRNKFISDFDKKQIAFNPFRALLDHPMLYAQWQAFIVAYKSLHISNRDAIYLKKLQKNYKSYGEYISDLNNVNKSMNIAFVNDWLSKRSSVIKISDESILKMINHGDLAVGIYELKTLKDNPWVFKRWMEYYVIPKLKKEFPRNKFIQSLTYGIQKEEKGASSLYFKVPLNMMEVDNNEESKLKYRELSNDFNSLDGYRFQVNDDTENNSISILDLLYIYNILSNRGFSRSSLSRFFTDMVISKEQDNIAVDHANYLDSLAEEELSEFGVEVKPIEYQVPRKSYYEIVPSNISKLSVIPQIGENKNIIMYDNSNAIEVLVKNGMDEKRAKLVSSSAKAFVFNGKVFINTDLSDRKELRHELAHVYIGVAKMSNDKNYRDKILEYYKLHEDEIDEIIKREVLIKSVYSDLKNTDLIEEGIAHFMETSYDRLSEFINFFLNGKDIVSIDEALGILKENVIVANSQKVALFRNKLIERGYALKDKGAQQVNSVLENCK